MYRYLKGWFFLDLLSVLPFDKIGLVITKSATDANAGGDTFDPSVLRIIRLVRFQQVLLLLLMDCVGVDSVRSFSSFRIALTSKWRLKISLIAKQSVNKTVYPPMFYPASLASPASPAFRLPLHPPHTYVPLYPQRYLTVIRCAFFA